MGEARRKKQRLQDQGLPCIFCGGVAVATTEEHCPPRSLFRDRQWPEGFAFPACQRCNGGSSDDDLLIAFLAHLGPEADEATRRKSVGLMKAVHRQAPGLLGKMLSVSAVEARKFARKTGMKREPGMTFKDIGVVNVPDQLHAAVGRFALKLTKAVYYRHAGLVLPANAGVLFQWFTNAELREHGRILVLDAMKQFDGMSAPITRTGQDLSDQFDYKYSVDEHGALHMLQVVFGEVFGFVSIFSQEAGRMERIHGELVQQAGKEGPFTFVSGGLAANDLAVQLRA